MAETRRGTCQLCEHCIVRGGWKWPKCEETSPMVELDTAFIRDPASACPLDKWPDMAPRRGGGVKDPARSPGHHCIFGEPAPQCSSKTICWRREDTPVVPRNSDCMHKCEWRVEQIHVSAIIVSRNEGEEVARTLQSLTDSVAPSTRVRLILVDDASTDGSCDDLEEQLTLPSNVRLTVIRNEEQQGVGRSRNIGAEHARGNVLTFHDAHMRFPPGCLETIALRALRERCITYAHSRGFKPDFIDEQHDVGKPAFRGYACDLFYNAQDGLQPKWRIHRHGDWERSPCIMGAGYAIARHTAKQLIEPTGQLWEDTAGKWGFSEQALSVKAFLLGVPIYVSNRAFIRHLYRSTNPLPMATHHLWRNIARAMALLLPDALFQERFYPIVAAYFERPNVKELLKEARSRWPDDSGLTSHWVRDPLEIFTHLCGRNSTIDELHPDHAWLADVQAAAKELGPEDRVLAWRAGEAPLHVRYVAPQSPINVVEIPGHRSSNWANVYEQANIKLHRLPLADGRYSDPNLNGPFRLVLVGGEDQQTCLAWARSHLTEDGVIVRSEAAEHDSIAQEFRKTERKTVRLYVDETGEAGADSSGASGTPSPEASARGSGSPPEGEPMNAKITVLLLNWRRPQHLPRLLECLDKQTLPLQAFLWDNSGELHAANLTLPSWVTLAVSSSRNLGCFVRWELGALARTPFICSMDDDLLFRDERVLEDACAAVQEETDGGVVGFLGWSRVRGKSYRRGRHHTGTTSGTRCDIIKGRFMCLERSSLVNVPLDIPGLATIPGLSHREDDIIVSLCTSRGEPDFHCIPKRLGKRWKNQSQKDGASAEPGHYQRRDAYIQAILHWLAKERDA